jgi:hypothetical protein
VPSRTKLPRRIYEEIHIVPLHVFVNFVILLRQKYQIIERIKDNILILQGKYVFE